MKAEEWGGRGSAGGKGSCVGGEGDADGFEGGGDALEIGERRRLPSFLVLHSSSSSSACRIRFAGDVDNVRRKEDGGGGGGGGGGGSGDARR